MKHQSKPDVRKHGIRYPWDDWFAQQRMTLTRGKHFQGEPHGMLQTARQAAAKRGLSISGNIQGNCLTIRVTKKVKT